MKNRFLLIIAAFLAFSSISYSQNRIGIAVPISINKNAPTIDLPAPNMQQIQAEDEKNDKNGKLYRIGVSIFTNISPENSGLWTTQPNGDRVWELNIKSTGAEALSFIFDHFELVGNSSFVVTDSKGNLVHKPVYKEEMLEDLQQNLALCFGDALFLKLTEPAGTTPSVIHLSRVIYNYRSTGNPTSANKINESESCEVNVNCSPVGDNWQDEKRGVARVYVVETGSAGWCSGTLINNTANDCKPLFLTALHCGVSTSAANSNLWKFYFRYEAVACTSPTSVGTLENYYITGCVRKGNANDGGGNTGSDFLLVQLGTANTESTVINQLKSANFNAYWNGWDANNTPTTNGVGIHHPAGDIKKISTFSGTTTSTSYGGTTPNTHWQLSWTSNSNGWGITEGGSSGSPIFNSAGRQVGTLTGGSSFCTDQSAPDIYGKMSYHWASNSTTNPLYQLKTFLDPTSTGLLTLNGSPDPCATGSVLTADFAGTPTSVTPGSTVAFTDLSSGNPTSWSWTITPGTAGTTWSYTAGTSATSQNPQVIFNTVGQYTISLTATNTTANSNKVRTNYIIVAALTTPCTATSTAGCATATQNEFISNVTLNTINNQTNCSGYTSYSSISTSLARGASYSLTISPSIMGSPISAGAYTNDEIAAWVDWNNDFDFDDAGERIAYVLVQTGWSNVFTITVPTTALLGAHKMRCRISDGSISPITPCGSVQYGEVEDYTINVVTSNAGVDAISALQNINIYPNPTSDKLTIDLSGLQQEEVMIQLVDNVGNLLISTSNKNMGTVLLDVSNFASGMYFVHISTSESETIRKINKQ